MSDKRISELPAASDLSGVDLVPVVQGGVTKKATVNQLQTSQLIDQNFVTVGTGTIPLHNSRLLMATAPLNLEDGGPGNALTLEMNNSGVTAGAYTNANITINAQGLITVAANGTGGGGGGGSVTSVALAVPAEFSLAGSPITSSGTMTIGKANQSPNTVWAGPTSGASAPPSF